MLTWARTVDDRLKRNAADRRKYPEQGLIPALAEGPRREAIIAARSKLLQTGFGEARYLAGLNLHMQSTRGSRTGEIRSSRVALPFADPVHGPISHRWRLNYVEGRDGVAFADDVLEAVAQFMDEMIIALEDYLPDRLKNDTTAEDAP